MGKCDIKDTAYYVSISLNSMIEYILNREHNLVEILAEVKTTIFYSIFSVLFIAVGFICGTSSISAEFLLSN